MHADLHGEVDDVADSEVPTIRLRYGWYNRIGKMLGLRAIVAQLRAIGRG
jgi:hypothetical protein